MYKKTVIFLVGFLFLSCFSKKEQEPLLVTQNFKINVLKQILSDTSDIRLLTNNSLYISNKQLSSLSKMSYFDSISNEFKNEKSYPLYVSRALSVEDTSIVNNQILEGINISLLSNYGYKILDVEGMTKRGISLDSIDVLVTEEYKSEGLRISKEISKNYLSIGTPIFNSEKNKMFLTTSSGSGGFSMLFEKRNENWEFVKKLEEWVE